MVGIQIDGGFSNPMIGYSASLPWIRAEANMDLVNTWTKIKGNHTFKWGVDLRRLRDDLLQDQTYSPRGHLLFRQEADRVCTPVATGSRAGHELQLVEAGNRQRHGQLPAGRAVSAAGATSTPISRPTGSGNSSRFGGDKWQVSPKLTMDLGLRWEYYPPATPQFPGGFSNYDPTTNRW